MLVHRIVPAQIVVPLLLSFPMPRSRAPQCSEAGPPQRLRSMPPLPQRAAPEVPAGGLAPPPPPDPVYDADVWLRREDVRYADGVGAPSGRGYCVSYLPFTVEGNHTRAVLVLAAGGGRSAPSGEPNEATIRSLADRIALSCECVVLMPTLAGGAQRWQHGPLLAEVDAATRYVNRQHRAQALGVLAFGEAASVVAELAAQGGLEAHALVAMEPTRTNPAALRELDAPLLCLMGDDGAPTAQMMRDSLALNGKLRGLYYVSAFEGCAPGFLSKPSNDQEVNAADQAASFAIAWFDRHVPERPPP